MEKEQKLANLMLTQLENSFDTPNQALTFLAAFVASVIHKWAGPKGQESRALAAFTDAVSGVDADSILNS